MQAAVIRTFGDPDVLKYEEIATPKPKPKHILINPSSFRGSLVQSHVR